MNKSGTSTVFLLLALLLPLEAAAGCEMNPYDSRVQVKVSQDARALELRKDGGGCRIALDCTLLAKPVHIRYELATLVKGKVAPYASQMSVITFEFADGARQTCRNAGTKDLD